MRRILFNFIAAAICSSAFITGCTTETKDNVHYVNLSQVACSFLGEGNSPLAVDVKASPAQWTATPGATIFFYFALTGRRTHKKSLCGRAGSASNTWIRPLSGPRSLNAGNINPQTGIPGS